MISKQQVGSVVMPLAIGIAVIVFIVGITLIALRALAYEGFDQLSLVITK